MVKKVRVGKATINYYETGKGQPLLLVHGWTNNWRGSEQIMNYLKKDHKIYAIDCPGYGDSSDLPSYSLEIEADYIARFIRKLKIKPVFVGTSMGSWIGSVFAQKYSNLVDRFVFIGLPLIRDNKMMDRLFNFYSFLYEHEGLHPFYVKFVRSKAYGYGASKFINMYKFNKGTIDRYGMVGRKKLRAKPLLEIILSCKDAKVEKLVPKIKTQTLIIWGENDRIVDYVSICSMLAFLKNGAIKTEFIPECGHAVHFEKPKEACEIISKYLRNS